MIELRKLNEKDYLRFYEYVTDEDIVKQFSFNYNEETCMERLNSIIECYTKSDKIYVWAITLNDALIGILTINSISYIDKNCSIGGGIIKEYRGMGYAYEAIVKLLDYVFNNLDMHRLELTCNVDNIASRRIIEKIGAKFEGIARESGTYDNKFVDRRVYSLLKEEYSK